MMWMSLGNAWLILEWCLMGFSVLASINNIALFILVSVPTCCDMTKRPKVWHVHIIP